MKVKMKVKLDKTALQQFFLDNGEKIIFAAVALGALAMVYGAWMQNSYRKRPSQLTENGNSAEQFIERTPVYDSDVWKVCSSPDFWKLVEKSKNPIEEDVYAWSVLLDKDPRQHLKTRPQPELYAAQKLQGTPGLGAFSFSPQAEREGTAHPMQQKGQQGVRYVVVTALVPWEQQTAAYQEAFHEAAWHRPASDEQPQYGGFRVQRALVAGSPGQNPQWETIANSWTAIPEAKKQWTKTDVEAVDPKYLIGKNERNPGNMPDDSSPSPLVFPLGPLMCGVWGPEVAHPPEIPIMPKAGPFDLPKTSGDAAAPEQIAKKTKPGEGPDFGEKPEALPLRPERLTPEEEKIQPPKFVLLRFFDFSVAPGAMYRYRVCLVLRNPNYKVESRYLADPESATSKSIESPWSEPTGVIVVPPDIRILARAVTLSHQGEPEGKVVVLQWMKDSGDKVHEEFPNKDNKSPIVRGQNLDFVCRVRTAPQPVVLGAQHSSYTEVKYTTGAIAVDFAGGDGFAGEILVLDQSGKLVAHNNIDDNEVFQRWEEQEKATEDRGPGPRGQPINHGRPRGINAEPR